ncbi:hypothetical protein H5410_024082 [Solanum commersonii]|uniref:Uncharacterized protein n=1 Tax=Solanum commersonii TaxID=4109 RepID=A0A9J5ZKY7_SOLCO|nr:hypothetical protein H5410_024082 [Solanum commersonii]
MIYRDRTGTGPDRNGTGMNRDEPVPVYRYQIMIPFRSVYRFNVSRPVPNTTGPERTGTIPERYRYNPFRCPALDEANTRLFLHCKVTESDILWQLFLALTEHNE